MSLPIPICPVDTRLQVTGDNNRLWFFTDYYSISPGMVSQICSKREKTWSERFAYSLEEIEAHLDLFSANSIRVQCGETVYTPTVSSATIRALIAVAAFAGLRHGEIRGLWWEDDDDDRLMIRRSCGELWWRIRRLTKTRKIRESFR